MLGFQRIAAVAGFGENSSGLAVCLGWFRMGNYGMLSTSLKKVTV